MQHSEVPHIELARACEFFELMKKDKTFEDFESHWKLFLHHIERLWLKSKSHYKKSPKWARWARPYEAEWKSDQLLQYLHEARNAEQHTVAEIVSKDLIGGTGIGFQVVGGGSPENALTVQEHSNRNFHHEAQIHTEGDMHFLEILVFRMKLLPMKDRNRKITAVPTIHLKKPIDNHDVLSLAACGYNWYAIFLNAAEEEFVD